MARENIARKKIVLRFATPFAPVRPGWHPKSPLSNSAPRPRPAEFIPQRRLALGLWIVLAQVFLSSFRPVFLTRRRTAAMRSWLLRLGRPLPRTVQNMAPASSAVPLLSMTPLLPRRLRFTVELMPSRLIVAWRSLALVPHRLSPDATYWIACNRWEQQPSRASGDAFFALGWVWQICPSANFDEHPPVRPTFSIR